MSQYYTVTELAFGDQKNPKRRVCFLADVRNASGEKSIRVWSHDAQKLVSLPRSQISIHPTNAKRWMAITAPKWLINREQLWRQMPPDETDQAPNSERSISQWVVDDQNKYTALPGQRMQLGGSDSDGGRTRRR